MNKIAYTHLTANGIITTGPCILYSLTGSTNDTGLGYASLYDGVDSDCGRRIAIIRCAKNTSVQYIWKGLELQHGLYALFASNMAYVTVEWEAVGYPKPSG